eukprot:snap_masked-scaffold_59-processed-gene-0.63-mRNA-1 protein AED:1.00 eAED:1.00 QI:0/0/0/0/1/1/3/0/80
MYYQKATILPDGVFLYREALSEVKRTLVDQQQEIKGYLLFKDIPFLSKKLSSVSTNILFTEEEYIILVKTCTEFKNENIV